ncbi:hypothetical protein ACYOEI_15585 [Singulisphaera rosea]
MLHTDNPKRAAFKAKAQPNWAVKGVRFSGPTAGALHRKLEIFGCASCVSARHADIASAGYEFPALLVDFDVDKQPVGKSQEPMQRSRKWTQVSLSYGSTIKGNVPKISRDVEYFCDQHKMSTDTVLAFVDVISKNISIVGEPSVIVRVDPEDDDTYLVVRIKVRGSSDEFLEEKDRAIDLAFDQFGYSVLSKIRIFPEFIEGR